MKPEAFDNIYFIGIGGIGMSALARYFASRGKYVSGYDKTPSPITSALQEEGIPIHFEDSPDNIPGEVKSAKDNSLIIYTPAVPDKHKELLYLREAGYSVYKRSQVLGYLSEQAFTIAVGGAHGKTSTCAFIAHLLKTANIDFYGFLGGIATNYKTNFLEPENYKQTPLILAEADEYDRSFLQLYPDITVLTSSDPDHLDIYETQESLLEAYQQFARQTKPNGLLVHLNNIPVPGLSDTVETVSFGLSPEADWHADNIRVEDHHYTFDLVTNKGSKTVQNGVPGEHNVLNLLAGAAALKNHVTDNATIQKAARSFKGVKRRFEYILNERGVVLIDDYAHHPRELDFTIETLKKLYPEERITGLFQPHLYSRTRDFAREFANVLTKLDSVVLLPIYPAREAPIEGVSSQLILDYMDHPDKHYLGKEQVEDFLASDENQVIATLGAGDIDRLVKPIRETLKRSRSA